MSPGISFVYLFVQEQIKSVSPKEADKGDFRETVSDVPALSGL